MENITCCKLPSLKENMQRYLCQVKWIDELDLELDLESRSTSCLIHVIADSSNGQRGMKIHTSVSPKPFIGASSIKLFLKGNIWQCASFFVTSEAYGSRFNVFYLKSQGREGGLGLQCYLTYKPVVR